MKKTVFERKIEFLREFSERNGKYLDVMNSRLVDEYSEEFNVSVRVQVFGANICRDLGKTLAEGYKRGILDRGSVGISGMELGFPKWVYVYSFI